MSEPVVAPGELSAKLKARLSDDHGNKVHGRSGRLYFERGENLYRVVLVPDTEGGFTVRSGVKPLRADDVVAEAMGQPIGELHTRIAGPLAVCFLDQTPAPVRFPATAQGIADASAQVGALIADFEDADTPARFIDRARARYRESLKKARFDLGMALELAARPRAAGARSDYVEAEVVSAWAGELSDFLGVKVRQKSNFVCFAAGANFFQASVSVGREVPTFTVHCQVKPYTVDDTLWDLIGPYLGSEPMPESLTWRADGTFTVSGLSTHRDTHHKPPVREGVDEATDLVLAVVKDFGPATDDRRFMEIAAQKYPSTWETSSTQTLGLMLLYRTGEYATLRALINERRARGQQGSFSFSDGLGQSTSFFDVLSKAMGNADLTPGIR